MNTRNYYSRLNQNYYILSKIFKNRIIRGRLENFWKIEIQFLNKVSFYLNTFGSTILELLNQSEYMLSKVLQSKGPHLENMVDEAAAVLSQMRPIWQGRWQWV